MRSMTGRVVLGVITLLLLAGLVQLSRDTSSELLPSNRNPDSTIQAEDGGLLRFVQRAGSFLSVDGEDKAEANSEEVGRVGQRQLSVLSGTASAYCGATCADGYSAGIRGNQQCLNELPDAIPGRVLNRLLDQGIRVLYTSEQRRLLMPNMKDPSVSWAYWKVTCFYNDVVVEGPVSVIEEFVGQYRRPLDSVSSQDVDDPFTRLGNAINNFREAFSGQQEKESASKSESKIAAGVESKDLSYTHQNLGPLSLIRRGMNYSDVTRLLGPPIEQSQGVTAAVWFYCDTGSYEDEAAAIFFQAKYEAAESLRSQSPDSFIVVEVQGYKVALDDVGETGDCKNFVRKGGYKPPAWLPQDLRK